MVKKMAGAAVGIMLISIAIILFAVQHFGPNLYGDSSNKWYFYGLVGIIGLVGIVVAIYSYARGSS